MTIERFEDLARVFRQHRLDRRRLMQTAGVLGLSTTAAGGTLSHIQTRQSTGAQAQSDI